MQISSYRSYSGSPRQAYLAKANRQLTDEHFHKKMDSDPTKEFSVLIIQTLDKIYNNDETTVIL